MTLWAFSRRTHLTDAWNLLDHLELTDYSLSLLCFGALLMECERKAMLDLELALLKGFENAGTKVAFGVTSKSVAAVRLATANHMLCRGSEIASVAGPRVPPVRVAR